MNDLLHPTFVDYCESAADLHPDEYDPFWEHFWTLKKASWDECMEQSRNFSKERSAAVLAKGRKA